jgi:hypothetical protein
MEINQELLTCPICGLNIESLAVLNEHLDNNHSPDQITTNIVSWLKRTHKRVLSPFSKVASTIPNQLLRINNTFKVNSNAHILERVYGMKSSESVDFDAYVGREHWIDGENASCMFPSCDKTLGIINGKVNCRK